MGSISFVIKGGIDGGLDLAVVLASEVVFPHLDERHGCDWLGVHRRKTSGCYAHGVFSFAFGPARSQCEGLVHHYGFVSRRREFELWLLL